ncbi:MAG: type II toxin-antitoxin system mRNA interferase toxin, RelE/StbE family [Longimicrobiales bacterium]|nr:type II toxin-antitoxin system mRNA interferase toxin, RelE/StbE family [Longimicrobiales bacterium]
MERLIAQEPVEERHRDHELSGEWQGHRDCHIRSDWLLICRVVVGGGVEEVPWDFARHFADERGRESSEAVRHVLANLGTLIALDL